MASTSFTIGINPELREAIDIMLPVTRAAVKYVECVDAKGSTAMCQDEYAAMEAVVEHRKRWQRANKPLRVVE